MTKYELRRKIAGSASVDKENFIQQSCAGKAVLDLGCIRHSAEFAVTDPDWLHEKIKSVANRVVGVDYLPDEIKKLKAIGYDVTFGDVTKPIHLGETFDVVVAGDLIEHLTNFEGFFDNIDRHLNPGGALILTTPNPFYTAQFHYIAFKGDYLLNPEHTCWIDPQALSQLIDRFGLFIDEIHFIENPWRLAQIICNSESNEYDIFKDRWEKNSTKHKVMRKLAGFLFNMLYIPYRLLGPRSALVRYSDYLAVIKRKPGAVAS